MPTAPLDPEDPRFLLVHHSATTNDYTPDAVPAFLRQFYALHTGPEKGWPDVAYNFFVDRYGGVWEGRTGSLDGPVRGDATGGNQGYSQLCCFVGDHQVTAPTIEAQRAMTHLLAFLGERYRIDTSPGASTAFTSLGSNRWPYGTQVTTTTIAGHRDMSETVCPGDAAYTLVREVFPAQVTAIRLEHAAAATTSTTDAVAAAPHATVQEQANTSRSTTRNSGEWPGPIVAGAASVGLLVAGAVALRLRLLNRRRPHS